MSQRKTVEEKIIGELLDTVVTANVNIVNAEYAEDPNVQRELDEKIGAIGNSCRGNIARALTKNYNTGMLDSARQIAQDLM